MAINNVRDIAVYVAYQLLHKDSAKRIGKKTKREEKISPLEASGEAIRVKPMKSARDEPGRTGRYDCRGEEYAEKEHGKLFNNLY